MIRPWANFGHFKRVPARYRGLAISLTLCVLAAISFAAFTLAQGQTHSRANCTRTAISGLPTQAVNTVQRELAAYNVSGNSQTMATWVLMTRQVDKNVRAVAFALFAPEYCGFLGNIDYEPTTRQAASGQTTTPFQLENDPVYVLRNGKAFDDNNVICVSNTVPTAKRVGGHLTMIMNCDRAYPFNTWTQNQPDLRR